MGDAFHVSKGGAAEGRGGHGVKGIPRPGAGASIQADYAAANTKSYDVECHTEAGALPSGATDPAACRS